MSARITGSNALQNIPMTLKTTHTAAEITTTRSDQLAVHRRPVLMTCERSTPTFGVRSVAIWRSSSVRSSTLGFSRDAGAGLCVIGVPFVEVVLRRVMQAPPNQVTGPVTACEGSADPQCVRIRPGNLEPSWQATTTPTDLRGLAGHVEVHVPPGAAPPTNREMPLATPPTGPDPDPRLPRPAVRRPRHAPGPGVRRPGRPSAMRQRSPRPEVLLRASLPQVVRLPAVAPRQSCLGGPRRRGPRRPAARRERPHPGGRRLPQRRALLPPPRRPQLPPHRDPVDRTERAPAQAVGNSRRAGSPSWVRSRWF